MESVAGTAGALAFGALAFGAAGALCVPALGELGFDPLGGAGVLGVLAFGDGCALAALAGVFASGGVGAPFAPGVSAIDVDAIMPSDAIAPITRSEDGRMGPDQDGNLCDALRQIRRPTKLHIACTV